MIAQKTYWGPNGHWIILSYDLEWKHVLIIHREGMEYDIISDAVFASNGNRCIGRQAWHSVVSGVIYFDFDIPFFGSSWGFGGRHERINVVYET